MMMYKRYGLPKREQDPYVGWTRPKQLCACGVGECSEAFRHNFKALVEACLGEPRWPDPAYFPVPRETVAWEPPPGVLGSDIPS